MSPVDSLRTETKFKKTEIGEIPVDWEFVRLADYCEVLGGSTPSTKRPEYWNGDIPWAVPTDITKLKGNVIENTEKKITEAGLANSAAKIIPAGSILLTSRATIGECAINLRPMATNQGFANLVCRKNLFNWFLLYRLKFMRKELESFSSGSTFREISKRSLRELRIPLPPISEQELIATILSDIDKIIEKNLRKETSLANIKEGLMERLMSGKIRISLK
jgi:type I restriction enzyme S subunit